MYLKIFKRMSMTIRVYGYYDFYSLIYNKILHKMKIQFLQVFYIKF